MKPVLIETILPCVCFPMKVAVVDEFALIALLSFVFRSQEVVEPVLVFVAAAVAPLLSLLVPPNHMTALSAALHLISIELQVQAMVVDDAPPTPSSKTQCCHFDHYSPTPSSSEPCIIWGLT